MYIDSILSSTQKELGMEAANNEKENELNNSKLQEVNVKESSFGDWLLKLVMRLLVAFLILWQFEGLWLSTQPQLSSFLRNNFPEKYREEQLKLSRFNENNVYLNGIENELNKKMALADKAILEKGTMERKVQNQQYDMEVLCRYYNTSILMFGHLANKYSEQELNKLVSCTNQECFDIIERSDKAKRMCQNI